jgi:DDE superfamily endonuclease
MLPRIGLPLLVAQLLQLFEPAFYRPTFQRVSLLLVAAILSRGRRTIAAMLWVVRPLARGHSSDYHRIFSRSPWSQWLVGKVLAALVMELVPADRPVVISVDDTIAGHRGDRVYGKGCHRDAVRSTRSRMVFKWGHRWVCLAVNVRFFFAARCWALPVICALYRPRELDLAEGRRHKSTIELAQGLIAVLLRWFPDRRFIVLADGDYGSHRLARFARRHRKRLTLVSKFYPDAALYDPPPPPTGNKGRPRLKGERRPSPHQKVAGSKPISATVCWYGGQDRRVQYVSKEAYWYQARHGMVNLRWVFVQDRQGTHRDEYLFSTDPQMSAEQIISLYTARWSIEVTFQEVREHLGFEKTRQWKPSSVLRMTPCLLGLFSVICVIYARMMKDQRRKPAMLGRYRKEQLTFSDVLFAVRRLLWAQTILPGAVGNELLQKITPRCRDVRLDRLADAA